MSAVTIKNPDGSTFKGCECVAAIWPLLNAEARKRGIVKSNLDVMQGSYNQTVRASAKTHYYGGVLDLRCYAGKEKALSQLLDEFGFCPFRRGPRSYDGFDPHFHVCLRGCPHMHWQAANQVVSWTVGRDGLVRNWKDRDRAWRVTTRDWKSAVSWYKAKGTKAVTKAATAVAPKKAVPAFSFDQLDKAVKSGKKGSSHVRVVQNQLNRSGWSKKIIGKDLVEDGFWGAETTKVYAGYQYAKGYRGKAADGKPGKTTVTLLLSWLRNPYRVI